MYNFSSTPQAGLNNRSSQVSAAAAMGGGSTVNGVFLNRGAAEDYDAWPDAPRRVQCYLRHQGRVWRSRAYPSQLSRLCMA